MPGFSTKICGSVFEQLARYTMRYQESDLHLGLYSSYSSQILPNTRQSEWVLTLQQRVAQNLSHAVCDAPLLITARHCFALSQITCQKYHNSCVNPLSPKIQIQILQADLHTFLLRIVERIWFKIKVFSLWSSI